MKVVFYSVIILKILCFCFDQFAVTISGSGFKHTSKWTAIITWFRFIVLKTRIFWNMSTFETCRIMTMSRKLAPLLMRLTGPFYCGWWPVYVVVHISRLDCKWLSVAKFFNRCLYQWPIFFKFFKSVHARCCQSIFLLQGFRCDTISHSVSNLIEINDSYIY